MSFLKKHWRFTMPAVVVLCVLLVGVVVLYSTNESSEPTTVYTMPARGLDNSVGVNTAPIAPASPDSNSPTDVSTTVSSPPRAIAVSHQTEAVKTGDTTATQFESSKMIETEDEAIMRRYKEHLANGTLPPSASVLSDDEEAFLRAYEAKVAKDALLHNEIDQLRKRVVSLGSEFIATLSPEERQQLIKRAEAKIANMNAEDAEKARLSLANLLSASNDARPQQEVIDDINELRYNLEKSSDEITNRSR